MIAPTLLKSLKHFAWDEEIPLSAREAIRVAITLIRQGEGTDADAYNLARAARDLARGVGSPEAVVRAAGVIVRTRARGGES